MEINSVLKDVVNTLYDYQKIRIALDNRIRAGNYSDVEGPIFVNQARRFGELEREMEKYLSGMLGEYPIYNDFLIDVKGVGPRIAGCIIAEIDIHKADTVSKLWAFSGLNVVDGHAPRPVKGEKLKYNKWLRMTLVGKLATSFMMSNSPYRRFYDDYRNRLEHEERHNDKTPLHKMRMARRYMVKMFLRDLYVAWRTIEGLPIRESYQEEYLGHGHVS